MATFKGLIKICEHCGAEFKVPQSHSHVRTCSRACGYAIRLVANKKEKIELKCVNCGGIFFERECHADRRKYCSISCKDSCPSLASHRSAMISGDGNPSWKGDSVIRTVSSSGRKYTRRPLHIENEKGVRRKRAIEEATPKWADLDKVQEIYRRCREVSEETGIKNHVDHIVPLTSAKVCGFHNEFNLRILPAIENLRKHNRVWPDMW